MVEWQRWGEDAMAEKYGSTFDMTEAGTIAAPPGKLRVCGWHFDWDERPRCFVDVDTLEQAHALIDSFSGSSCGFNADYATAHDEQGETVATGCPWDPRCRHSGGDAS